MVAFASQSENDGFQFTTPPVRTRSKSVLQTPKYKECEELTKQQSDESEKVNNMSMDISLNSVHCDDDAEEEEIRSNSSSNQSYTTNERGRDAVFRLIDENGDGFLQKEEVVGAIEMMCDDGELDLGGLTSLDAAERMMHEADVEGDGQIDMDELTLMMEKK